MPPSLPTNSKGAAAVVVMKNTVRPLRAVLARSGLDELSLSSSSSSDSPSPLICRQRRRKGDGGIRFFGSYGITRRDGARGGRWICCCCRAAQTASVAMTSGASRASGLYAAYTNVNTNLYQIQPRLAHQQQQRRWARVHDVQFVKAHDKGARDGDGDGDAAGRRGTRRRSERDTSSDNDVAGNGQKTIMDRYREKLDRKAREYVYSHTLSANQSLI